MYAKNKILMMCAYIGNLNIGRMYHCSDSFFTKSTIKKKIVSLQKALKKNNNNVKSNNTIN